MDDGRVYVDDCVQELKKPYKIGSVLKTHEQAASADDVEDLMTGDHAADAAALKEMMADPLRAPVEPGHARVSWLTGLRDPTVVAAAGLKVIDRPFLLGDAVASAADPGGESGVIWQIRSSAEVQYVNASGLTVQQRVARPGLELISTVCDGDITVHRTMGWVGFIKGAAFTVTVKCAPGQGGRKAHKAADRHRQYTFRKLTSMEESPLQCEDEDAGLCQHFPGQRVTIDVQELIKTDLLPDGWTGAMSHKGNTGEYEVVAVELDEAYVDWAVAGPTSTAPSQPPMEWIPVAELLWLQLADAGYRIGDHVRITDPGILNTMPAGASTARITSTSTECRVQWGKTGLVDPAWCASSSLVPRPPTATKDFLPRSFVTRSNDEEEMMDAPLGNPLPASAQPPPTPAADGAGGQPGAPGDPIISGASSAPMDQLGLVTKVDNAQQTCAVRWLTQEDWADPVEDPGEPVEVIVEIDRMALLQSSGFDVSIVDGSLMVTNVAENCPTWNKLLAGDILLSVNGIALPEDGCQLSDVAQILIGLDTATVKLELEREADQKPTVLDFAEETVSVYDIQMKDDLAFVLGDIVMHGPAFDEAYYGNPQNANGNPQDATTLLESAGLSKEEVAGLTMEEFRDLKAALAASQGLDSAAQDPETGGATPGANPPATGQTAAPTASTADSIQWLGQIIEITVDGWLIVRWMDKSFTKTLPIDVILVEPSEHLPPSGGGYDDNNYPSSDAGSEWTDVSGDEDAMETEYEEFSTPDPPTDVGMQETVPLPPQADPELRASSAMEEDAAPAEEEEPEVASLDEYAVLELLDDVPADHQFSGEPNANVSASVIHKELKALRKGLPQDGSIFIRSYETRTDLLRAVIFGPENTPYANIPFFFDLMLPNGYPHVPPKMLYHASAARERLNPNLYETGKVCLSLLGTWNGPGWDPKTSSLLQVFMSIQALVLVEEPYFNEPGFEKLKGTAEGTRNSQMYSENAILLSLQSLIALKSRPPTGFGGIMKLYYKEKGARILERFQQTAGDSETGFALTLGKRYLPRLEALFAKK